MSKAAVVKLFIGSILAMIAALFLGLASVIVAYNAGVFVMDGPDVVGVDGSAFGWAMIGLALLAIVALIGGAIGTLVAWIGSLLNTAQLDDKAWFIALLLLGLFSFGFIAMIAYLVAGPDGTTVPARTTRPSVTAHA